MHRTLWPLFLVPALAPLLSGGQDPVRAPERDDGAGQVLFLQHCATCHGETGDGRGVTQLDRPARSFRDGGFSFGNTPEALYRTISTGIPGTPMPGFDTAIDEAGRRVLARYVRSLGPAELETDPSDAVLEVADVPLVVRGHLPPICEGAEAQPRGLLLGTTSGLTFEYRADDVRLLGIRQGPFVERLDWSERGGTPLRPLGPVIHTVHGGRPGELFRLRGAGAHPSPLRAKLRTTWVRAGEVGITYGLLDDAGAARAEVEEIVRALATRDASGFMRVFRIQQRAGESTPGSLSGDLIAPIGPALGEPWSASGRLRHARVYRSEAGLVQLVTVAGGAGGISIDDDRVTIDGQDGVPERTFVVTTLLFPQWDAAAQSAVRAGLGR